LSKVLVIIFYAVGLWCFVGVFEKCECFDVVFWWSWCGVLRGWRGVLAVTFFGWEKCDRVFGFIFGASRFGIVGVR
jgi:hypothetical protein